MRVFIAMLTLAGFSLLSAQPAQTPAQKTEQTEKKSTEKKKSKKEEGKPGEKAPETPKK
jgi:hypothetical protein